MYFRVVRKVVRFGNLCVTMVVEKEIFPIFVENKKEYGLYKE